MCLKECQGAKIHNDKFCLADKDVCVFCLLVFGDDLWSSHAVFFVETLFDFDVDSVAESCCDLLSLVCFLFAFAFDDLHEGGVSAELDGTFGKGEHLLCAGKRKRGVCAVSSPESCVVAGGGR